MHCCSDYKGEEKERMKINFKKIISSIMLVILLLNMTLASYAAESRSVYVSFVINGKVFKNLPVQIFKLSKENEYSLNSDFENSGITLDENFGEDMQVLNVLAAFVNYKKIKPYKIADTNENGTCIFENLSNGVYFIKVSEAHQVEFQMEVLPMLFEITKDSETNMFFNAKGSFRNKNKDKIVCNYTVIKRWANVDKKTNMPDSIKVAILRNGEVVKETFISRKDNWTISFFEDENNISQVVETEIPKDFTQKIEKIANKFVITNTYNPPPKEENPPPPTETPKPNKPPKPGKPKKPKTPKTPKRYYSENIAKTGNFQKSYIVLFASAFSFLSLALIIFFVYKKHMDTDEKEN